MKLSGLSYVAGTMPVAQMEAKWAKAEAKLSADFPRVDPRLWEQLKLLSLYGERHRVPEDVDPMVHAYLLSQLFCFKVMSVINDEIGVVPVHARLGCVGPASPVSIKIEGLENIDLAAVENDFLQHLKRELGHAALSVN